MAVRCAMKEHMKAVILKIFLKTLKTFRREQPSRRPEEVFILIIGSYSGASRNTKGMNCLSWYIRISAGKHKFAGRHIPCSEQRFHAHKLQSGRKRGFRRFIFFETYLGKYYHTSSQTTGVTDRLLNACPMKQSQGFLIDPTCIRQCTMTDVNGYVREGWICPYHSESGRNIRKSLFSLDTKKS